MRRATTLAIALMSLLAGCGQSAATRSAIAAFEHFQDALFAADAEAVRALVTDASAPVVEHLPWQSIRAQPRLRIVDATDERGCFHVQLCEATSNRPAGAYVVTRENGRFVVDLIATAALHAVPTGRLAAGELEARSLSDRDFARIQELQPQLTPPATAR